MSQITNFKLKKCIDLVTIETQLKDFSSTIWKCIKVAKVNESDKKPTLPRLLMTLKFGSLFPESKHICYKS